MEKYTSIVNTYFTYNCSLLDKSMQNKLLARL